MGGVTDKEAELIKEEDDHMIIYLIASMICSTNRS